MNLWKANVASNANAQNLLAKVIAKTGSAELVEKLENKLGKRSKSSKDSKQSGTNPEFEYILELNFQLCKSFMFLICFPFIHFMAQQFEIKWFICVCV